jgi:hypothetical protein
MLVTQVGRQESGSLAIDSPVPRIGFLVAFFHTYRYIRPSVCVVVFSIKILCLYYDFCLTDLMLLSSSVCRSARQELQSSIREPSLHNSRNSVQSVKRSRRITAGDIRIISASKSTIILDVNSLHKIILKSYWPL